LNPRRDSPKVCPLDHAALAEYERRQDTTGRVFQSAHPTAVALRTDITYPLPVRRASTYFTTDPVEPSRAVRHRALVEIYPLQPLTQHILASHSAYSAAKDARASAGQGTLTSSDTTFEHEIGANPRLRADHPVQHQSAAARQSFSDRWRPLPPAPTPQKPSATLPPLATDQKAGGSSPSERATVSPGHRPDTSSAEPGRAAARRLVWQRLPDRSGSPRMHPDAARCRLPRSPIIQLAPAASRPPCGRRCVVGPPALTRRPHTDLGACEDDGQDREPGLPEVPWLSPAGHSRGAGAELIAPKGHASLARCLGCSGERLLTAPQPSGLLAGSRQPGWTSRGSARAA
jgi:hypothetical protein